MLLSAAMLHLPDGYLSPLLAGLGWLLVLLVVRRAVNVTGSSMASHQASLMGLLAAVIFAAQAVNFPVAFGTSGHLLGGALAAILIGPWAAVIVMTAVIALQALLFQDGGLLVMGWNVVNMGVLTAFSGYLVYTAIRRLLANYPGSALLGGLLGGWISVEVGAMATAVELGLSGTFPLQLGIPAMIGVHALIGIGEGVLTAVTIGFLATVRPALVRSCGAYASGVRSAALIAAGILGILGLALLAPHASGYPDGLEWVANQGGFEGLAGRPPLELLPDYSLPLLTNPRLATAGAVLLGSLLLAVLGWLAERSRLSLGSS
jgi:cobalt/nickel transport system permease protein